MYPTQAPLIHKYFHFDLERKALWLRSQDCAIHLCMCVCIAAPNGFVTAATITTAAAATQPNRCWEWLKKQQAPTGDTKWWRRGRTNRTDTANNVFNIHCDSRPMWISFELKCCFCLRIFFLYVLYSLLLAQILFSRQSAVVVGVWLVCSLRQPFGCYWPSAAVLANTDTNTQRDTFYFKMQFFRKCLRPISHTCVSIWFGHFVFDRNFLSKSICGDNGTDSIAFSADTHTLIFQFIIRLCKPFG